MSLLAVSMNARILAKCTILLLEKNLHYLKVDEISLGCISDMGMGTCFVYYFYLYKDALKSTNKSH